jgi:hypothetical protein
MIEIDRIAEAKERLAGFTTETLMLAFPDYRSLGACIKAPANCIGRFMRANRQRSLAIEPVGDCWCRRGERNPYGHVGSLDITIL